MRKTFVVLLALTFLAAMATLGHDQETRKPLSPPAKAEGTISGKTITIDYHAPSKRGRTIMGGLVPYGKVWRTGANDATTLTTEANLMIGNLHVPKGTYTLFTIPGETEWTLIVNKETGQWGTRYDASQDLGRVTMSVTPVKDTVETFVIGVNAGRGKNGTLTLTWENTEASVPVTVQ